MLTEKPECESCGETDDVRLCSGDGWIEDFYRCDNCNEKAYESYLSDYYGGSGPVTMKEQAEAAYKEKRYGWIGAAIEDAGELAKGSK